MPARVSVERRSVLEALGAEVVLTPASEGTEDLRPPCWMRRLPSRTKRPLTSRACWPSGRAFSCECRVGRRWRGPCAWLGR